MTPTKPTPSTPSVRNRTTGVIGWGVVIGATVLAGAITVMMGGFPGDAMPTQPTSASSASRSTVSSRDRAAMTAWNAFVSTNFAGDQACAECHEKEYQAHLRSGHSRTLTRMRETVLAERLAEMKSYQDPRREQTFEFEAIENQIFVRDPIHAPGVTVPVTWLLGSGTHAQTPIAVDESTQSGVELRWSFFPRSEAVGLTPDHQRYDDFEPGTIDCFGRPMDNADIRSCLGCHSTVSPPPSLPLRNDLFVGNVGCERCHGPRKKHVELAHQGRAGEIKPLLRYETAETYIETCAACHRDESSVDPNATANELVRFQPYGIQRSRCYLETPGHLTCSTCHDPHDTVSHDRATSIEQCQQCHGGGPSAECPQQPDGDCIDCHMPLVEWTTGIAFHDHWIRVQTAMVQE